MKNLWANCSVFLPALLLFAAGQTATPAPNPDISVLPFGDASSTSFAVTMDGTDADEAIANICYWDNYPGLSGKIVRCRDSVIPIFVGVATATDAVPVPQSEIKSVRVRLVRVLYEKTFPYKNEKP